MVERDGKVTIEVRYFILSIPPKVKTFSTAVRGHWSIENSLHWVLDVVFKEDASQIRIGHGPENFGFLRRFVISLLKQDSSPRSVLFIDTTSTRHQPRPVNRQRCLKSQVLINNSTALALSVTIK